MFLNPYQVAVYRRDFHWWKGSLFSARSPKSAAKIGAPQLESRFQNLKLKEFKPADEKDLPDYTVRVTKHTGKRFIDHYFKPVK